ncbi:MAG TPA: rod shape-determining protein RodA [Terriglobales bacterium]|nr:rod shape-determining protein RodA [Terriglobales bacterium]
MLKIDRRLVAHFDWALLTCTVLVVSCGLATVFSATYSEAAPFSGILLRQMMWAGAGLVALLLALSFDYHWLERYGYFIYAGALVLLILTPLIGTAGGGARRWIAFGPVSIQPSEFAKIPVIVAIAAYIHREVGDDPMPTRLLLGPVLLLIPPALLVLKQPDLGTALTICGTAAVVLLVAGLHWRLIAGVATTAAVALPFLWPLLKDYQKQRIWTFLDPQSDPLGSGYHIIQSKIAIGSGMLFGKGYLHGTQTRLNFLPEQHTDFIFAVFAEEWGFVGGLALLGLYGALLTRCFIVAVRAKDNFGLLLASGLSAMIFGQVVTNMGMAMGALPVVGITLPFFSYGGSSMLISMIAIGLLMNISMRRFTF